MVVAGNVAIYIYWLCCETTEQIYIIMIMSLCTNRPKKNMQSDIDVFTHLLRFQK